VQLTLIQAVSPDEHVYENVLDEPVLDDLRRPPLLAGVDDEGTSMDAGPVHKK
jgi:hypothetical protein